MSHDAGCAGVYPAFAAPIGKHTNVIEDDHLATLWRAAGDEVGYPFGTIFQLLALTAQRRAEVTGIRGKTVILMSSARVEGEIHQMSLAIEAGAEFVGRCRLNAA